MPSLKVADLLQAALNNHPDSGIVKKHVDKALPLLTGKAAAKVESPAGSAPGTPKTPAASATAAPKASEPAKATEPPKAPAAAAAPASSHLPPALSQLVDKINADATSDAGVADLVAALRDLTDAVKARTGCGAGPADAG